MTIMIKPCSLDELDELLTISRDTFFDTFAPQNPETIMQDYLSEHFTVTKLFDELNTPSSHFYFAFLNNQLAGYLKLNEYASQTEKEFRDSLEIERIYVLPEFKGQHIGSDFINFSVDFTRKNQLSSIWLGVWEHNLPAIKFYEHHGFKQVSQHSFFMGDDEQTDYILLKPLKENN